jgi:predicted DNA-binding transcriptional regulator YafY
MRLKNDRLFQLLYLLLENGTMTAPALSERLEVSVRTVYRDVDALARAGVPIYATAGKRGGVALMPGFTIDRSILSGEEQDKLLIAVQSLRAAGQEVDDLLSKLGAAFRRPSADWIMVDFSRWGMRRTDTERFELFKTAILGCQVLRITYCGASGRRTERKIHPLRLVYKDKNWYLQAYCLRAGDFRLFKIGRVLDAAITGETFPPYDGKAIPPVETEEAFGQIKPLTLRFSPRAAFRVYDEFERGCITEEPDGSLRVEAAFPMDSWAVGYLLSFGTDVEVLSPAALRQELADCAEKIYRHHKP